MFKGSDSFGWLFNIIADIIRALQIAITAATCCFEFKFGHYINIVPCYSTTF